MHQYSLVYRASHVGPEGWQRVLEVFRAAVTHLGAKDVQDQCDVAKSTLSEALNEKNDKRVAGEWLCTVIAMLDAQHTKAGDELLKRLLDAIAGLSTRYVVSDASDEPTPEEVAAAERVLAKVRARKRAA